MNDIFLVMAGVGGVAIALAHGWLGQRLVLSPITGLTPTIRAVNAAVFQLSTLYWLVGGIALAVAPWAFDGATRSVVVFAVVFMYASAAVANAWATRGRHFGWMALGCVTIFALLGL